MPNEPDVMSQPLTNNEAAIVAGHGLACRFNFGIMENDQGVGFRIIVTDANGKAYLSIRKYDSKPLYLVQEARDILQAKFGFAQVLAARRSEADPSLNGFDRTLDCVQGEEELVQQLKALSPFDSRDGCLK